MRLGLRTKYSDFLEWYIKQPSDHELIAKFKKEVCKDIETWSNFELKLGRHTVNFSSYKDFLLVCGDLKMKLGGYLELEQKKMVLKNKSHQNIFCNNLCYPENFLTLRDRIVLNNYKGRFLGHHFFIKIITFNYTKIIEMLLPNINKGSRLIDGKLYFYDGIIHVHGNFNDAMILGVNDISQIENNTFREEEDLKDCLIKSQSNYVVGDLNDEASKGAIKNADMICLYGLSLGETDKYWWNLIKERMIENKELKLIIFYKDEELIPRIERYKKGFKRREIINRFFSLTETDVKSEEAIVMEKNILVEYDSNIFDISLEEENFNE